MITTLAAVIATLAGGDIPPSPTSHSCASIEGAPLLWGRAATRFIIVGEMHGTTEIPAFFGDLVCAAHSSGRPVVVAVEALDSEQASIDQFISSDGGEAAKKAFLQSAIWHLSMKDGRSSRAYFDLFERLRIYSQAGWIAGVAAIQPSERSERTQTGTGYNAAMAERFRGAARGHANSLVLVLVGNIHARKSPYRFGAEVLTPATADLPPEATIALNVATGGEAWNCYSRSDCGVHPVAGHAPKRRSVALGPGAPDYDGTVDLGTPSTASPPTLP
jgi:hypothetical protein